MRKNDSRDSTGKPPSAGLVIGASDKGYFFDHSVPHVLVVGKTGSGKSQLIVLEILHLLMASSWNIIATGRPEMMELTAGKVKSLATKPCTPFL